jgi:RNA polymerase sigma-70 factor (ECF subfamily)
MIYAESKTLPIDDSGHQIRQAKAGCETSLGELLDHARGYLQRLAGAAIDSDVRGQLSASDVVQETMMNAQVDFDNFQGEDSKQLVAWLRRILINNLLNHYRRLRKTQKRDVSREFHNINFGNVAASDTDSPSSVAAQHEDVAVLEEELARLPNHYREIIELHHREDLSFVEIGDRLSKTPDAVRMMWYRAFDQLSRNLEKRLG